jgi:hypothetical protein
MTATAGAMPERTTHPRPGVTLEARIKAQAYGLGFDLVGLTRTGPAHTSPTFEGWLQAGHAGEMHYLDGIRGCLSTALGARSWSR